jgi:hypothetical protein
MLLCFLVAAPTQAFAVEGDAGESDAAEENSDEETPADEHDAVRRAINVGVAVLPGLVVHGAGHFAAGDAETGWKLVGAEIASLGLTTAGVAGLLVTGAADQTVTLFVGLTALGGTSFVYSWLADIYGVATTGDALGRPQIQRAPLDFALGYQYVHNPTFDFGHFVHAGAAGRVHRLGIGADGWFALDENNWRLAGEASWRFLGPLPDSPSADGSFVDAETGIIYHDYDASDFAALTVQALLRGRYDLHHFAESLRGSFVEGAFGYGLTQYTHDEHPDDTTSLLLFDASFGVYLGDSPEGYGEAAVFYNHRHDGFVGGLKIGGVGSGPVGGFGVRLVKSIVGPWGFEASAQAGSAYVGRLNLVFRPGGSR